MKKFLLVVALCILTGGVAIAGNMDTYGIGAKATSLGGAYTANANDPYAAYYNPAGLTQMKTKTVSIGAVVLDPSLKIDNYTVHNGVGIPNAGPEDMSDTSSTLIVPTAGFSMPLSNKLSAGIALYAPFGLNLQWQRKNIDNPGIYNAYEAWIGRIALTPTIAYKINKKLSIGFGISLGKAEAGQKYQVLPYSIGGGKAATALGMPAGNYPVYADVDLNDDFNCSYNIGIMFKPMNNLSFGLTYRSRTSASYEGDVTFGGAGVDVLEKLHQVTGGANGLDLTGSYHATLNDVDFPEQVQFGMRYMPTKKFSVETDLVWTHWNIIEHQTLVVKSLGIRDALPRNWKNTVQLKLGTEWFVNNIFTLRAGYYYDPTPIPDSTFDIPWPDGDKHTFSIGFGLNVTKHWTIDGVVQYVRSAQDRKITGESKNLNHSYNLSTLGINNDPKVDMKASGSIWGYGLTVSYNF